MVAQRNLKRVFESKLPVLLCRTSTSYDHFFYDFHYWRRVPKAEYDRWVDRCEELDRRIELCLRKRCHIVGEITNWRYRSVEVTVSQLSDKGLDGLQKLLRGRFRDWRIGLSVWSEGKKSKHLGGVLIDRDGLTISRGLATYFPFAECNQENDRTGRAGSHSFTVEKENAFKRKV